MVRAMQGADALLAKITEEYRASCLLAKVNCDIEQEVVARFGIRSLPTVVLFGRPAGGRFRRCAAGIRDSRHARAPCTGPGIAAGQSAESAEAAFAEGRFAEAEAQLQQLLSEDNENAAGLILYARCLAERGRAGRGGNRAQCREGR